MVAPVTVKEPTIPMPAVPSTALGSALYEASWFKPILEAELEMAGIDLETVNIMETPTGVENPHQGFKGMLETGQLDTTKTNVVPYHTGGNHFAALLIDFQGEEEKYIATFYQNSMGTKIPSELRTALFNYYKEELLDFTPFQLLDMHQKQQSKKDVVNCGPLVCANIVAIVKDWRSTHKPGVKHKLQLIQEYESEEKCAELRAQHNKILSKHPELLGDSLASVAVSVPGYVKLETMEGDPNSGRVSFKEDGKDFSISFKENKTDKDSPLWQLESKTSPENRSLCFKKFAEMCLAKLHGKPCRIILSGILPTSNSKECEAAFIAVFGKEYVRVQKEEKTTEVTTAGVKIESDGLTSSFQDTEKNQPIQEKDSSSAKQEGESAITPPSSPSSERGPSTSPKPTAVSSTKPNRKGKDGKEYVELTTWKQEENAEQQGASKEESSVMGQEKRGGNDVGLFSRHKNGESLEALEREFDASFDGMEKTLSEMTSLLLKS